MYCKQPLLQWAPAHPRVQLSLFIDEIAMQSFHSCKKQLMTALLHGCFQLPASVKHDLQCQVAEKKSAVLASSRD
eukprot:6839797-Pyramimonas_sp.AAC.1